MPATITDRLYGENSSVAVKAPVRTASVGANLQLTGLQTVGGVSLNEGDRILVKDQANPIQNGIYNVSSSGWTRTGDFDGAYDVVQGTLVIVLFSTSQMLIYQLTTPIPVIGTTPLNFSPYANLNTNYPQTPSEAAAGLAPVNQAYLPGNLQRWGVDLTGATDNTAQINTAIAAAVAAGGPGIIYHPGGIISHSTQITIPNGLTVLGSSRVSSVFQFTGNPATAPAATRSAWRYTGVAPWSGFANVAFRHVKIFYQNTVNFAAAIELSAWGWSYFEIDDVWVRGGCSYGVILDGVEIGSVHNCLVENQNAVSNYNLWIVNGADRGFTQGLGFSNVITIRENQINGGAGSFGLVDDGGSQHVVQGNNFNGHRFPMRAAGVQGIKITGNSFETQLTTGSANVDFDVVSVAGNPVGPVTGFEITSNGFFGNMSGGSLLVFGGTAYTISNITQAAAAVVTFSTVSTANPFVAGQVIDFSGVVGMTQINGKGGPISAIGGASGAWTATVAINSSAFTAYGSGGSGVMMHAGGFVKGNNFGSQLGRGAAIDLTFLANSECSSNYDLAQLSGMTHYTAVHNDNLGNTLMPPQNGFPGSVGIPGPLYGDARFQSTIVGGLALDSTLNLSTPALAAQNGGVYQGIGAPNNANGSNGDIYFRTDTPGTANQRIYIKSAGAWTGIA